VKRAALAFFALLLNAQDFSEIKFDHLAKGLGYAEGPAWSREGFLIFSDTPADQLMKWVPGTQIEVFRANANGPSGNAFDGEGRLYTCETRTRRVVRMDKKGAIEVVADKWEGKRLNAPNDIVVNKANGHVYFTDPAFGSQGDHRELDFYGVYHLPPKGPLKLVAKPAGRPNGVALSPNGRILYVVNSDERNVRAYDLDKSGEASNERVVISKIPGVPGGIRTDANGNLYVAGKAIFIHSPDGKLIHTFELHSPASNCGFGEIDGRTLFITAGSEIHRARLDVKGAY
jgi:sugar lactone lactonase YvrE